MLGKPCTGVGNQRPPRRQAKDMTPSSEGDLEERRRQLLQLGSKRDWLLPGQGSLEERS